MGEVLNINYFAIDHDRENNPNSEQVAEEINQEEFYIRETILQKYVTKDLDGIQLSGLLNRLMDLAYFTGRFDGEKYNKKQEENNYAKYY